VRGPKKFVSMVLPEVADLMLDKRGVEPPVVVVTQRFPLPMTLHHNKLECLSLASIF
jgi:hypothetical protein